MTGYIDYEELSKDCDDDTQYLSYRYDGTWIVAFYAIFDTGPSVTLSSDVVEAFPPLPAHHSEADLDTEIVTEWVRQRTGLQYNPVQYTVLPHRGETGNGLRTMISAEVMPGTAVTVRDLDDSVLDVLVAEQDADRSGRGAAG